MILILFWNIEIDTSANNFLWICCYGIMGNFLFCGQGYFLGVMVLDETAVKLWNFMFIMLFMASNGILANLTTANWFIKFMGEISPVRYTCEGFVRHLTMQIPDLRDLPLPLPVKIPIS